MKALRKEGVVAKDFKHDKVLRHEKPVLWITAPTTVNPASTPFAAYGNEPTLMFVYGTLVLTARVPSYENREAVLDGRTTMAELDEKCGGESSEEDEKSGSEFSEETDSD